MNDSLSGVTREDERCRYCGRDFGGFTVREPGMRMTTMYGSDHDDKCFCGGDCANRYEIRELRRTIRGFANPDRYWSSAMHDTIEEGIETLESAIYGQPQFGVIIVTAIITATVIIAGKYLF